MATEVNSVRSADLYLDDRDMDETSKDLRNNILKALAQNPVIGRSEIRQLVGLQDDKKDADRLNKTISRMKQAGELVDGFYFGEAWMQHFSRYHVMIATAPPKNGELTPGRKTDEVPSDGDRPEEEPDFQQKVCQDIRSLLHSHEDYSAHIVLGEAVILTGGGDWDVQLTMYVDNKSHELFRRFIRRQLRMHPAVLRTNTVAVSLIPLTNEESEES
ncbi:MAG: hypothetical protein R3C12_21480 [Planctomycetaceae bacterium]